MVSLSSAKSRLLLDWQYLMSHTPQRYPVLTLDKYYTTIYLQEGQRNSLILNLYIVVGRPLNKSKCLRSGSRTRQVRKGHIASHLLARSPHDQRSIAFISLALETNQNLASLAKNYRVERTKYSHSTFVGQTKNKHYILYSCKHTYSILNKPLQVPID